MPRYTRGTRGWMPSAISRCGDEVLASAGATLIPDPSRFASLPYRAGEGSTTFPSPSGRGGRGEGIACFDSPMTAPPGSDPPQPRKARLGEVVAAVLWSFFGVRKRAKLQADAASIRPHQVVLVGIAIAAIFVLVLLLVVRIVIRVAGA